MSTPAAFPTVALSEWSRSVVSLAVAGAVTVVAIAMTDASSLTRADACVLALLAYLVTYLPLTCALFSIASPANIADWAEREDRGSFAQRYIYGTAPGPGVSLLISAAALAVALFWIPARDTSSFDQEARIAATFALVVVAWGSVVVSFAVAFHGDNIVEDGKALDFPGQSHPGWADYIYFAVGVMSTFGATDVTVTSSDMRMTVTVNSVIAFVFNTIIVATVVSTLASL